MTIRRPPENPILVPGMLQATRPELEVAGVFNPGVIRHAGEVLLLVRVSEEAEVVVGETSSPVYDVGSGRLEIKRWSILEDGVDATDPRIVVVNGRTWLTSLSHLRVARSRDGIHFKFDSAPALFPATPYEAYGVEDPRITLLDGTYWINYTAVSSHGIATALASTKDFRTFQRHGIIFPPDNRDVTIFPEKIGDRYVALHRPMPSGIGTPGIWIASSTDLISWGDHRVVATARNGMWDDAKIGGGAVPFRVRTGRHDGWLAVYHGVTAAPPTYSLGALLLDPRDPGRVLARSREPILRPEADYEREGFFAEVVFTCGLLAEGDLVRIYYGAADGVTAVADLSLANILMGLTSV